MTVILTDQDHSGNRVKGLPAPGAIDDAARTGPIIEDVATTTYTFQLADVGKIKRFTNVAGCTATLPNSFPVSWNVMVTQGAAGQVTLAAASGATLHAYGSLTKTAGIYAEVSILTTDNSGGTSAVYLAGGAMG